MISLRATVLCTAWGLMLCVPASGDTLYATRRPGLDRYEPWRLVRLNGRGEELDTFVNASQLNSAHNRTPVDYYMDSKRGRLYVGNGALYALDMSTGSFELFQLSDGYESMALNSMGLPNLHVRRCGYADCIAGLLVLSAPVGIDFFPTGVDNGNLAIDKNDVFHVTSSDRTEILRFTRDGAPLDTFVQNLDTPTDMAFDATGNLYVSELDSGLVKRFGASGESLGVFATGLNQPTHLAFDTAGNLYVAAQGSRTVERFAPDGAALGTFASDVLGPIRLGPDLLLAGDANQDLMFDQLDLVKVLQSGKYLTQQRATWDEGDWNGAPGGHAGFPPLGDGVFNQADIVAALAQSVYLTGRYAALAPGGAIEDDRLSVIYDSRNGEVRFASPVELISILIESAAGMFTGDPPIVKGSFQNVDPDHQLFQAGFRDTFSSWSFGAAAEPGLTEQFVLSDLSIIGSLPGGEPIEYADLIYIPVPEPNAIEYCLMGAVIVLLSMTVRNRYDYRFVLVLLLTTTKPQVVSARFGDELVKVVPNTPSGGMGFGNSVSISGDLVLVGARNESLTDGRELAAGAFMVLT